MPTAIAPSSDTGRPRPSPAMLAVLLAFQVLLAFGLSEAALQVMYRHPLRVYPAALRTFFRAEYFYRRHIIQLDERTARYDPELLYTLRPGTFTFSNLEFSTPYTVNSLGVRDVEQSLTQPEIVVVGDSYAMGWGVQQHESFPELLRQRTGRRLLNTGIASYGTTREMRLLDRVDLSRATTLVVQYHPNDFDENDAFETHGNRHEPSSREEWLAVMVPEKRVPRYWPFPMVYSAATWIKRSIEGRRRGGYEDLSYPADRAARLFLNALMHAPQHDLSHLRIVAFDVDPDPAFIQALGRMHTAPEYPQYIHDLVVVNVSARLTPDLFYELDDHMRPAGHVMLADALLPAVVR